MYTVAVWPAIVSTAVRKIDADVDLGARTRGAGACGARKVGDRAWERAREVRGRVERAGLACVCTQRMCEHLTL
eukprot:70853-Chlamydomonas_euryale.AAC.4